MDATSPQSGYRLPIRFVGSGSEYFRIWIVNLLLTVVTLGLYFPFAKVRRLRYFHGATEVGGHALSFHGDPWAMFRGYVLMAALFIVYGVAGRLSPLAGLVAFVILAALWPALWHSSLRFRLANTGWRGLRARFDGTRGGAYLAMLPGAGLALVFVVFGYLAGAAGAPADGEKPEGSLWLALLPLLVMAALPALFWAVKRYQHAHYALAGERTRFTASLLAMYGLALRSFGLGLLALAAGGALLFLGALALRGQMGDPDDTARGLQWVTLAPLALLVLLQALIGPYLTSRLQNLVWNGTRSQNLAFESALRYRDLMPLTLRNWLFVVVTLGLFYPFAKIATARLRLQAVTLLSALDPDTLLAAAGGAASGVSGDAAADLLGIDLGL